MENQDKVIAAFEAESQRLGDELDEANNEMLRLRRETQMAKEALADAKAHVAVEDSGSSFDQGESLGDIMSQGESLADMLSNDAISSPLEAELDAVKERNQSMEAEIKKLEATLLANREVMGMTIEEQMMMLEDQIGLKIRIDELEDEVVDLSGENKRHLWEAKSMHMYMKNRDAIVYGLLEKPVKAKDRKKLLKILKDTAAASGIQDMSMDAPLSPATPGANNSRFEVAAEMMSEFKAPRKSVSSSWFSKTPTAATPSTSTPAPTSAPSVAEQALARRASSTSVLETSSNTPARRTSTDSVRSAPPARPFPKELLQMSMEGDGGNAASTPTKEDSRKEEAGSAVVDPKAGAESAATKGSGKSAKKAQSTPASTPKKAEPTKSKSKKRAEPPKKDANKDGNFDPSRTDILTCLACLACLVRWDVARLAVLGMLLRPATLA